MPYKAGSQSALAVCICNPNVQLVGAASSQMLCYEGKPTNTTYQAGLEGLLAICALQVLGREERSLAHLLRRYCGVQQDKAYQRADWRVRPLSAELIHYGA